MAKARPITGLDSQAPTAMNARIILQQRLDDLYTYAPYTGNPDNIQELHDLRIAAKRMRYTLELFEEFLPATSKKFADELARLQEELGALHDSEVMLALLRQLLQPEGEEVSSDNSAEPPAERGAELLSAGLTRAVLHPPGNNSALSTRERQGLLGFLHRQEQRREQSYALFHHHWQELEQKHFREAMLEMLNSSW
jgi:hypothetical protein